jgi:hypothetical protein
MKAFNGKVKKVLFVLDNLGLKNTFKVISKNTLYFDHYFALTANLNSVGNAPKVRGTYFIRKAEEEDFENLMSNIKSFNYEDRKEIIIRLFFYHVGFKNCYLAITEKGDIAAMQWLVYPAENELIENEFQGRFYPLKKNQLMLQNFFTFPRFRGLGYMPAMVVELMKMAKEDGYRNVIGYVRKDRIGTINEMINIGFKLRKLIREYKILGKTNKAL